jgi:hypothetical protein
VCGDLSNVFLQKSFSSQSLVLGYVNEFVCLFGQRDALGFSFHAILQCKRLVRRIPTKVSAARPFLKPNGSARV